MDNSTLEELSTEERILEAAKQVFMKRGTAGARTQEIAEAAGVNKALLHYYFRSKEKLAEAVFLRAARHLFPRMLSVLASDLPLREKLQGAIEVEFEVLEENPYLPGYMIAECQYRPEHLRKLLDAVVPPAPMRREMLAILQHQLDADAAAGKLRPFRADDLMVALISQLIFPFAASPILGFLLEMDGDDLAAMKERRRDDLADRILRGLAP